LYKFTASAPFGRGSGIACLLLAAIQAGAQLEPEIPKIRAEALRAHVSFLASDLLEGRETPSRGGALAAQYIASQMMGAGLRPAAPDEDYFQTTVWTAAVNTPDGSIPLSRDHVRNLPAGLLLMDARVVKVDSSPESVSPRLARGRVLLTTPALAPKLAARKAELQPRAIVAAAGEAGPGAEGAITVRSLPLLKLFQALQPGLTNARLTVIQPGLENVIGVLPGADPSLKDEYVIVSAHYDHEGRREKGGDRIYNGANDNASGVAAIIELASALGRSQPRPRRTFVFAAFFGEEKGMIGSRYYAMHPVVPLRQTVAQINLEQLGRTDDSEGPRVAAATVTGFDYSDVAGILRSAAEPFGVSIAGHPKYSGEFFERSDNEALARKGIPAHTISVAYGFPDYHRVSDEWPKLDYANMALVTRSIAAGILAVANRPEPPKWNNGNPAVGKYITPP
jgi:hypothetical protein